jgi:hypothetical protein
MSRALHIAVVNRFAPPDAAVTGRAAMELAQALQAALPQAAVRLYATTATYNEAAPPAPPVGPAVPIHRVPAAPGGAGRGTARLQAALGDGWRLAQAVTDWADVVISLTNPPLLNIWLGAARLRRRFHWVEWTMDLYPEAFAGAGLVMGRNPLYRALSGLQRLARPDLRLALGAQQREALRAWRGARAPIHLLPCGIVPAGEAKDPVPAWKEAAGTRTVLAYAGHVGEEYCIEGLIRLVRMADPVRFAFVLALHGSGAAAARAALADAPHVLWVAHLRYEELLHADVHLASLRPEWSHVCVPPEAVSSLCLSRPVLFMGAPESDVWHLTHRAGWCVPALPGGDASSLELERALLEMLDEEILARRTTTARLRGDALRRLQAGTLEQLAAWCAATAEGIPVESALQEATA